MRDGELVLSYSGTTVTFGLDDSTLPAFLTEAPDLGDLDIETADARRPRGDGLLFGKDFLGGRTITLPLAISAPTEAEALAIYQTLRTAWRADKVRLTAGATATLRFRRAGRERLVYGRPRRFAEDLTLARQGVIKVVADFAAADDVFYDVTEQAKAVGLVATPSGGLVGPLGSPLSTTASSDRSVAITVDAPVPAWPTITISGPVTNPVVEVVGLWRMEFRATLAYDQTLVVDTRPWARTVKRNGSNLAGSLTRQSTPLSKAQIPSGTYELAFRGASDTGTATATVRWRNSFPTL